MSRQERRRARRLAKWEHRPQRGNWRYVVGTLGRVLIAAGVLMFGFIAYLLWGTGLETARAQRDLSAQFDQLLQASQTADGPTDIVGADADGDRDAPEPGLEADQEADAATDGGIDQGLGPFETGEPVARLEIPSLGIDEIIVAGVGVTELKLGPGHFPETPLPGQFGRASVAGHRTTYGQPFRSIDQLEAGDVMITTTPAGRFVYEVTDSMVVAPNDYHVVNTTFPEIANLTLVTCHPVFSSSQRLVVNGLIVPELSDPIGRAQPPADVSGVGLLPDEQAIAPEEPTSEPDATEPEATEPDATETDADTGDAAPEAVGDDRADADTPIDSSDGGNEPAPDLVSLDEAFGGGWFDDPEAPAQVALWGGLLALIGGIGFLISRATRRDLVGFAVGVVPFGIASFFFFQNLQRLLPAGL